MPFYPLDGGRVVIAILQNKFDKYKILKVQKITSFISESKEFNKLGFKSILICPSIENIHYKVLNILKNNNIDIITGDFNADNFEELMPYTKENYIRTINTITTVDGKKFDDILIKQNVEHNSKIKKSVSDHYMVITTIE